MVKTGLSPAGLWRIPRLIKKLSGEFEDFFNRQLNLKMSRGSTLFLHSLYIFELLALAFFVKKNARVFLENNHRVLVGFNFGYRRSGFFSTALLGAMYKFLFLSLMESIGPQAVYFCDGEGLHREFAPLLKKQIRLFPVPLNNAVMRPYLEASLKKDMDITT